MTLVHDYAPKNDRGEFVQPPCQTPLKGVPLSPQIKSTKLPLNTCNLLIYTCISTCRIILFKNNEITSQFQGSNQGWEEDQIPTSNHNNPDEYSQTAWSKTPSRARGQIGLTSNSSRSSRFRHQDLSNT